jgi:hypothetical protein
MRNWVRGAVVLAGVLGVAMPLAAQLADLQPGRNFDVPSGMSAQFGTGRSENIDAGDCDNDGDLDVIVANGGDGTNQANRIYINQGGLQGGTLATFVDETATRFLGVPDDRSRDCEFVDIDLDGDLDVHISNRGNSISRGQSSRFYTNQGGLQGGVIGVFQETTDLNYGALVSVPLGEQVFGGNSGPFRANCQDTDFADLDDDGDPDMFQSEVGPTFGGNQDSRVFLNDGSGVFNELWPWADPAADTKLHAMDVDLADFDGDFDIDVVIASRNSQARVYLNNLYDPVGASFFQDITQSALLDTGAGFTGGAHYETEYGDYDGDGDFDLWMVNYNGNTDRLLVNENPPPGSGFRFYRADDWLKGDPIVDENECDFLDYDGDGDLDVFMANFSGTNWLYQSGLAQGLEPGGQGLFHRNGTGLAPWQEVPTTSNGGTTLDADCADMDNDGDEDLLLANDGNQQNRYFENALGVPDTHAPTFFKVTVQADKPTGTPTVVHAQIRDNSGYYLTNFYDAQLIYTLDGGTETGVAMFAQGSMQFRGTIPDLAGTVAYRVECTDLAGNTGVSSTHVFVAGGVSAWTDLGSGLAGVSGVPSLVGTGTLVPGSAGALTLSNAAPSASALLFVSFASTPTPFKGGTLLTVPVFLSLGVTTNGFGGFTLPWASWPPGLSPGTTLYFQYAVADAAGPLGASLSNAVKGVTP